MRRREEAGPERTRGGTHRVEDTAANLTGNSKGAERRCGGGPTALMRRSSGTRRSSGGDDGGHRRRSGTAELGTDGAMGRRCSAALGNGGVGEQEARLEQGTTAA